MKRIFSLLAAGLVLAVVGTPAAAKTDAPKAVQVLRCAHSYAEALAEAKDRGCVIFATFHRDG